jgi:phosphatidylglycerophosphate synthase
MVVFVAKQVADMLTIGRALIGLGLVLLGLVQGAAGLPAAVLLMLMSWTSDSLDGMFARRSRMQYHTWIGDHDLEFDIVVSLGLLIYMLAAGLVNQWLAVTYFIFIMFIYWYAGFPRSLGMLLQAPVYGWFIWVAVRDAPQAGLWLLVWIIAAVIITWPRFPRDIVPDFVGGIRSLVKGDDDGQGR